jgi:hypothetical protein
MKVLEAIAFFGVEIVFFLLVFLFLVFEKTLSIFGALAALVALSLLVGRYPVLHQILRRGFSTY